MPLIVVKDTTSSSLDYERHLQFSTKLHVNAKTKKDEENKT